MAVQWFPGRGKAVGNRYIIRKRNIQRFINQHGVVSIPSVEKPRLRKKIDEIVFFDLANGDKFIFDPQHFRDAEDEDGMLFVPIEKARNIIYKRSWE